MRLRSLLAWFPLVGLFAACGSDESSGGATGNTCAAGATQACTCSGTDTGVQVCAADGKSWGACGCGGNGGTGGGGGDAASGGGNGGTGASSGTGAVSGGGGTAGVAGDGSTDGGSNSDPCPTEPVDVDCSSDCGGPAALCSTPNPCINLLFGIDVTAKPKHVFRTASPPHQQTSTWNCCSEASPGFGNYGQYTAATPELFGGGVLYKVKVGKPWLVSFSETNGDCTTPQAQGCVVSTGNKGWFRIGTTDPNAGARNIILEAGPTNTTCVASDYWQ